MEIVAVHFGEGTDVVSVPRTRQIPPRFLRVKKKKVVEGSPRENIFAEFVKSLKKIREGFST